MNYPDMRADILEEFESFPAGLNLKLGAGFYLIRRRGGHGGARANSGRPHSASIPVAGVRGRPARQVVDHAGTIYASVSDVLARTGIPRGTFYQIVGAPGLPARRSWHGFKFTYCT